MEIYRIGVGHGGNMPYPFRLGKDSGSHARGRFCPSRDSDLVWQFADAYILWVLCRHSRCRNQCLCSEADCSRRVIRHARVLFRVGPLPPPNDYRGGRGPTPRPLFTENVPAARIVTLFHLLRPNCSSWEANMRFGTRFHMYTSLSHSSAQLCMSLRRLQNTHMQGQ